MLHWKDIFIYLIWQGILMTVSLVPGKELRFWSLTVWTQILAPPLPWGIFIFSDLGFLIGEIGTIIIITYLVGAMVRINERRWQFGQGRWKKGVGRDLSPFASFFHTLAPEYLSFLLERFSCCSLNSGTNCKHHGAENRSVVWTFTPCTVSGPCSELMWFGKSHWFHPKLEIFL